MNATLKLLHADSTMPVILHAVLGLNVAAGLRRT